MSHGFTDLAGDWIPPIGGLYVVRIQITLVLATQSSQKLSAVDIGA